MIDPILKYTGVVGLALFLLFLLFKTIFTNYKFSKLSQNQSFFIILLCLILFCIVVFFLIFNNNEQLPKTIIPKQDSIKQNIATKIIKSNKIKNKMTIQNSGSIGTIINGDNNKIDIKNDEKLKK